MNDDDSKLLRGFALGQTNGRTDICNCRVAFATEKNSSLRTNEKTDLFQIHNKTRKILVWQNKMSSL